MHPPKKRRKGQCPYRYFPDPGLESRLAPARAGTGWYPCRQYNNAWAISHLAQGLQISSPRSTLHSVRRVNACARATRDMAVAAHSRPGGRPQPAGRPPCIGTIDRVRTSSVAVSTATATGHGLCGGAAPLASASARPLLSGHARRRRLAQCAPPARPGGCSKFSAWSMRAKNRNQEERSVFHTVKRRSTDREAGRDRESRQYVVATSSMLLRH